VERRWRATVECVCGGVRIPVSVKLGPWLSSPGHFCKSLVSAGAKGLVLFNRFYQPDTDLETLKTVSNLQLSTPYEMRHALLWISLLAGRVEASLAATTGVDTASEVLKYLLAGADVVMTTSSLLRHGPSHLATLRHGLEQWMEARAFRNLSALRGRLSAAGQLNSEPLLRAQYMEMLLTYPAGRS
jgi:dihydroorotate dehydrogenase (fumarate)